MCAFVTVCNIVHNVCHTQASFSILSRLCHVCVCVVAVVVRCIQV